MVKTYAMTVYYNNVSSLYAADNITTLMYNKGISYFVDKLGENIKLYSPENCFFKHYLTTKNNNMTYGVINVEDRTVTFMGVPIDRVTQPSIMECSRFSINSYLMSLISSQNAEIVSNREEADVVLVMEKAAEKNEISLIDNNFFIYI